MMHAIHKIYITIARIVIILLYADRRPVAPRIRTSLYKIPVGVCDDCVASSHAVDLLEAVPHFFKRPARRSIESPRFISRHIREPLMMKTRCGDDTVDTHTAIDIIQ